MAGIDKALEKSEFCFSHIKNKYYFKTDQVYFSPFHTGQYTIFLYYLSNLVFTLYDHSGLAERIYFLNKILNSVELYYEVVLPEIFFLDHPLGSVMGRATYGNYFCFSQNCTVGMNKGVYPCLGEHVTLMAGVMIVGSSKIGNNCILSANTYIKDQDVPDNSIVFGSSPNLVIKHRNDAYFNNESYFVRDAV